MLHFGDICCVGNICFGIILDRIVIFASCNFWKSPFYCCYNARFSFGTNKNLTFLRLFLANLVDYFWQILLVIFAETCLLAVHNVESDKGQKEIWQPREPKFWTELSLPSGMLFLQTLCWLLRIISTILSRSTTGDIFTTVIVLCSPDWSDYFMLISRLFRMMTGGWFFSPLWKDML
jgi:hypothetical protein